MPAAWRTHGASAGGSLVRAADLVGGPPTGEESARWRGRITNVLDERSRVVQDFHHVEEFVKEYVQQWDEPPPVA